MMCFLILDALTFFIFHSCYLQADLQMQKHPKRNSIETKSLPLIKPIPLLTSGNHILPVSICDLQEQLVDTDLAHPEALHP